LGGGCIVHDPLIEDEFQTDVCARPLRRWCLSSDKFPEGVRTHIRFQRQQREVADLEAWLFKVRQSGMPPYVPKVRVYPVRQVEVLRRKPGTGCAVPGWNREALLLGRRVGQVKSGGGVQTGLCYSRSRPVGVRIQDGVHRPVACACLGFSELPCGVRLEGPLMPAVFKRAFFPPSPQPLVPSSSLEEVTGSQVVPAGTAPDALGKALGLKSGRKESALGTWLGTRLRPRSRKVNGLRELLGLPHGVLGAYLAGRWTPALTASSAPLTAPLARLFQGGAKVLGSRTAKVRPPAEGEDTTDTRVLSLWLDGTSLDVCPELVFHLSSRAVFRARDASLVPSLKLAGLEWCHSRRLMPVEVALVLPLSVALASLPSIPEVASEGVLDGRVESEVRNRWDRITGGFFGSGTLPKVPKTPGWWKKVST